MNASIVAAMSGGNVAIDVRPPTEDAVDDAIPAGTDESIDEGFLSNGENAAKRTPQPRCVVAVPHQHRKNPGGLGRAADLRSDLDAPEYEVRKQIARNGPRE